MKDFFQHLEFSSWYYRKILLIKNLAKYLLTSAAAVDPRHLKVEVADQDFPNYS